MGMGVSEEELVKAQLGVNDNGEPEDPEQDDDPTDAHLTHIEELGEVWGIDAEIAEVIIDSNNDNLLDQNMIIFDDGSIETAKDQGELIGLLRSYFIRDLSANDEMAMIAYVFLDGDLCDYKLDIQLIKKQEPEPVAEPVLEPTPEINYGQEIGMPCP
jgi:hypothetical protein